MKFERDARISTEICDKMKLWLQLQGCHNKLQNHIRDKLRLQFNTTLPRFDVMAQLALHRKGLKMGDLSSILMVSNGNITSIALQLEKDLLVERITNESDRRSTFIRLTSKGLRHYHRIEKAYRIWLMEIFQEFPDLHTKKLCKSLSDFKETIDKVVKSHS
ncbi:MarR family winged helix-turn-helix transcriptional regulator [Pelistega europaea]|uniref:MarR family transcriptional regulator n=1 Tax=Pelistega europaea TaxID=106147 RepID=A0A7Y4LDL2_9BURK|nr:MarR family transcriptional regulator [Pelistega europaea]NOL50482.1 MarR family transcriptional regulator [Pelistega europaea]